MAVTASTMILSSLVKIGDKSVGGTLSTAEQSAYLSMMNAMLDSWSIERLMVYQILQESKVLTANTGTYTMGPSGTFSSIRPTKIVKAFLRDSSNYDTGLGLLDYSAYDNIVAKSTASTYPRYLFNDCANVAGIATLTLYPIPSAAYTLFVDSWKQLQQFATITDAIVLPPGYQRAIEFNFAIEAAGGLISVQPEIIRIAKESKAAIMGVNLPESVLRMDVGLVRPKRSNILFGP